MTVATPASAFPQAAYRQPFLHDVWAGLSHAIGSGVGPNLLAPGITPWMPWQDQRRLLAYQLLQAYIDNVRRYWLPRYMWLPGPIDETNPVPSFPQALQYREYGVARSVVDSGRSLVLGAEQRFRVPAAEPVKGPDGGLVTPAPNTLPARAQAYLDGWMGDEKVVAKLHENESRVVGLGDGVLALGWDPDVSRPRLRCYDPGFYFPDWAQIHSREYIAAGWKDEDFPPVVHLAWEWLDPNQTPWIRRSTYRMVKLKKPRPRPWGGTAAWTCMFEQADYDPMKLSGATVHDFPKAGRGSPAVDLGIDFIPVVHVPNDYPGSDLWGRSILLHVAQILDDIASGDTDLALNSEVVASPKLITKNAQSRPQAGPGDWLNLFADGDASILDTSKTLDALLKHADRLMQLLARHTRLGQVLLGMVDPSQVPSGYSMRLGFASAASLEREMTQVRADKYGLLGRMVARFAQANGLLPAGPTPPIEIVLGQGLPADRAAAIAEVTGLLAVHAISTLTAVKMLTDAGLPIDDALDEVQRIQGEQPDKATFLVEATGDVQAARRYLGLYGEGPPPPAQPPAGAGTAPEPGLPPHGSGEGAGQQPDGVQSAAHRASPHPFGSPPPSSRPATSGDGMPPGGHLPVGG